MILDVVIVTFNRLEKLKKTLALYEKQTAAFRNLIVVNNHSTDGTDVFLAEWQQQSCDIFSKKVITTEDNLGGSGGFYVGQKYALSLSPDWVFLADDDAYPKEDMVEKFYDFAGKVESQNASAICATVYDPDGDICTNHRGYAHIEGLQYVRTDTLEKDYEQPFFSVDILSYVGSFVSVAAMRRVGLVNPDYFIYYDDTEHSIRLRKYGPILCVPAIQIVHDYSGDAADDVLISWQEYYSLRNQTRMLLTHYPLVGLKMLRSNIGTILKKQSDPVRLLRKAAFSDALWSRLGKHKLYKPGWKILK